LPYFADETAVNTHEEDDIEPSATVSPGTGYGRTMADLGHEVLLSIGNRAELIYVLPPGLLFLVAVWNGHIKTLWDVAIIGSASVVLDVIVWLVLFLTRKTKE
jgi:hypothetical protein